MISKENLNSVEDSKERLRIIDQINFDRASTLDECILSYLKLIDKESINERSLINLAKILQIKGIHNINIEQIKLKILDLPNKKKQIELKKEEEFFRSDKYNFIKQFAQKYKSEADNSQFANLQDLLSKHNFDFPIDTIKEFVDNEYYLILENDINQCVFVKKPKSFDRAVRLFVENFNSESPSLITCFAYLLKSNGFNDIDAIGGEKILVGLLISKIKKVKKEIEIENFERNLANKNVQIKLKEIDNFTGYEFEDFLKTLFSKMGYQVEQTKLSRDQGADLVVVKFGDKKVIQAKRFQKTVGNKAVQEIMAAISLYRANNGIVVTNNYFTSAAVELANANNIELID